MKHTDTKSHESGFTLVELMITLVISSIITMAIYSAYKAQRDVYEAQVQVTEIQQNLRAATWLMVKEIRMAGFDPQGTGGYKIIYSEGGTVKTTASSFRFDADMCRNGGAPKATADPITPCPPGPHTGEELEEEFHFELYSPAGAPANYPFSLRRTPNGSAIAEYIDALEFWYTYNDGTPTGPPPGNLSQADHIQSVQISILGRARRPDPNFTNNMVYQPASGSVAAQWGPYGDNYRRRLLTTTVFARNQGL